MILTRSIVIATILFAGQMQGMNNQNKQTILYEKIKLATNMQKLDQNLRALIWNMSLNPHTPQENFDIAMQMRDENKKSLNLLKKKIESEVFCVSYKYK